MAETVRSPTRVELPPGVEPPIEVYVNGVRQEEGSDFRVEAGTLVFGRELKQEGRLGFWRWASIVFGAAGTYRQNDVIDVIHEREGARLLVSGLPIEPD